MWDRQWDTGPGHATLPAASRSRPYILSRLFRLAALLAGCAPSVWLPGAPFNLLLSPSDWTVVAAFTTDPSHEHRTAVHGRSRHNGALGVTGVARRWEPETDWRLGHRRNRGIRGTESLAQPQPLRFRLVVFGSLVPRLALRFSLQPVWFGAFGTLDRVVTGSAVAPVSGYRSGEFGI